MILSAATPVKVRLSSRHNTNNLTLPPSKSLTNNFHYSCNKPNASSSLANESSQNPNPNSNNKELLHQINYSNREDDADNKDLVPSASAIAQTIRNVSNGAHVEFIQRIEIDGKKSRLGSSSPSPEFLSLCSEQLDLFRKIVDRETVLSVYVRPAGSYVMDRLELRRVTFYPGKNVAETAEVVVLIGSFGIPTGLRLAETALSNQQMEVIHERKAVVFPMVKHPFVVGFLVAEFSVEFETHRNVEGDVQDIQFCTPSESYTLPLHSERNRWDLKALKENPFKTFDHFTAEQRSSVINISCSLAMAYVMDQKAMLLQQSYWQNNIRMSDLVEQIRGSLSSIRSLSKMLSIHTKKSEISYDIIEDILVQGDQMGNTLQQLQDAVYLTKANIVRYNEELLRKAKHSKYVHPESGSSQLLDNFHGGIDTDKTIHLQQAFPLSSAAKDSEMPMPPLSLAPLQQHNIRPSDASYVLADLVGAAGPLAHKLQRKLELSEISQSLQVAVEESALRQALSNLIEGALLRTHAGGKVEIISTGAPAGGVLVVIDDDGPDMHYMTQMHSLTPFGPELFSDGMVEDSMTWNFISGLTVAREILESYGCVLRVISPRIRGAVFGSGGTRIELWFPSPTTTSDSSPQIEGG